MVEPGWPAGLSGAADGSKAKPTKWRVMNSIRNENGERKKQKENEGERERESNEGQHEDASKKII